jgi:hypothetical protein
MMAGKSAASSMPGRMGAGRPAAAAAPPSTWMGLLSPVSAAQHATSLEVKRFVMEKAAPGVRGSAAVAAAPPPAALLPLHASLSSLCNCSAARHAAP